LTKREIDQKAAIMIVIEHLGNVAPGTKCSAVFFDSERVRREREFYAKLYSENGVQDREVLRAMIAANVPDDPYWLVSLKTGDGATAKATRLCRVDDRTGKVLPDPT
jgi:N-acyl-D-aspartate/D-glutamate deacylase